MCLQRKVNACLNGNENKVEDSRARAVDSAVEKATGNLMGTSGFGRLSKLCSMTGKGKRTEDELLGGREHVKRESDLILVAFALQPSNQIRGI